MDIVLVKVPKPINLKINCCKPVRPTISTKLTNPVVPIGEWDKVVMSVNNRFADIDHAVTLVPDDIDTYDKKTVNEMTAFSIVTNEEILGLFKKG